MVRSVDIAPDEFAAFVQIYKKQQRLQECAVPDLDIPETKLD